MCQEYPGAKPLLTNAERFHFVNGRDHAFGFEPSQHQLRQQRRRADHAVRFDFIDEDRQLVLFRQNSFGIFFDVYC